MSRIALVRNRRSTRNMRSAPLRPEAGADEVLMIDADTLDELWQGLHAAREKGVSLVLVDGGDGTVREVLSRLPEIWGAPLPGVGILPRGNTNLIARTVGGLTRPDAVDELLHRLRNGQPLTRRSHPVLRIDYPGGERPRLRGFMMGWGAYAAGTRIAHEEMKTRGPMQIAFAILSVLRRATLGSDGRAIRRGVPAAIGFDAPPGAGRARLVGLATTIGGPLIGGLNPFWGEGPGRIRWLDIPAPARWLLVAVPALARGRPRDWMTASGYASGRAERISLGLDTPFVLDGDLFPAGESGPLAVSVEERIEFVTL